MTGATNRLAVQLPARVEPSPPLDPHDMTPAQRLDAFCDVLARVRLLEDAVAVLTGASDQQGRNIDQVRGEIGKLTQGTLKLPRVGR